MTQTNPNDIEVLYDLTLENGEEILSNVTSHEVQNYVVQHDYALAEDSFFQTEIELRNAGFMVKIKRVPLKAAFTPVEHLSIHPWIIAVTTLGITTLKTPNFDPDFFDTRGNPMCPEEMGLTPFGKLENLQVGIYQVITKTWIRSERCTNIVDGVDFEIMSWKLIQPLPEFI